MNGSATNLANQHDTLCVTDQYSPIFPTDGEVHETKSGAYTHEIRKNPDDREFAFTDRYFKPATDAAEAELTNSGTTDDVRGEAFLYAKYMAYAQRARETGQSDIADLFEQTARSNNLNISAKWLNSLNSPAPTHRI
jgi:hypothetical protein